jgi:RNA-binding protein 25
VVEVVPNFSIAPQASSSCSNPHQPQLGGSSPLLPPIMAAVAPAPDNLDPRPSTPLTTAATPTATFTSTPPNTGTPVPAAPNPNPNPPLAPSPVASAPPVVAPPMPPAPVSFTASFRPLGAPPPPPPQQQQVPHYGAVLNPGYPMAQPGVMPPGAMRPPTMYAPPPQPGAYMPQPGAAVPHHGGFPFFIRVLASSRLVRWFSS